MHNIIRIDTSPASAPAKYYQRRDLGYPHDSQTTDAHKLVVTHATFYTSFTPHRAPFSVPSHSISACHSRATHLPLTIIHHPNIPPKTHTKSSSFLLFLVVTFRPSTVRFRLPLTPPQGLEMPPKSAQYREVGTMETAGNVPRLNKSASRWRKADLKLLGVDYDHESCNDIHIPNAGMPAELVQSNSFVGRADL
jgi:hypothetical protein